MPQENPLSVHVSHRSDPFPQPLSAWLQLAGRSPYFALSSPLFPHRNATGPRKLGNLQNKVSNRAHNLLRPHLGSPELALYLSCDYPPYKRPHRVGLDGLTEKSLSRSKTPRPHWGYGHSERRIEGFSDRLKGLPDQRSHESSESPPLLHRLRL